MCQYQPKDSFPGIRADLLKLAYALLYAELGNLTAGEADSHQIFSDLKQSLAWLEQADEQEVIPLAIQYQMTLLHAEGYYPVLNECIFTGAPLDAHARFYCFSAQFGGLPTPDEKNRHLTQTGGFGEQWVNVSASTARLLQHPMQAQWEATQLNKAQKFLQYYFHHTFEKSMHAYDLVFNLIAPQTALPAKRGQPDVNEL